MLVTRYNEKRLVEYLKPGLKALVKFDNHGLGDMIMFQPLYQRLKTLYSDVEWHLKPNQDQGYFAETPDTPVDIEFYIKFPETTGYSPKYPLTSKPEFCAVNELGIPWDKSLEFTWKPDRWNTELKLKENCIGMVFGCNSDPGKSMNSGLARLFWQRVKSKGFRPIEVQFLNPLHNKSNGRCGFVDYSCRDFEASVENVIAVLKQCRGFIGINTGTFCAAVCILNGHVLHLRNRHSFDHYKRFEPVPEVDCTVPAKIDWSIVDNYLESCR